MYNDALASRDGYGTSHDDFETIRDAITAQQQDVNVELLDALKYAFKWMGNANAYDRKVYDKHYSNISNLIQRAEQKGGV